MSKGEALVWPADGRSSGGLGAQGVARLEHFELFNQRGARLWMLRQVVPDPPPLKLQQPRRQLWRQTNHFQTPSQTLEHFGLEGVCDFLEMTCFTCDLYRKR